MIKAKSAELIDYCDDMKEKDPRLAALAMTAYERSCYVGCEIGNDGEIK